jgi:hypothetical protein
LNNVSLLLPDELFDWLMFKLIPPFIDVRANADLLNTPELKKDFLQAYEQEKAKYWIKEYYPEIVDYLSCISNLFPYL